MTSGPFYGAQQSAIHHEAFGRLAVRAADRVLAELDAAGLRSGTVVDLGCGSGILARRMLEAGYDVLGVDISADMLEIARREAPGARFMHASIHEAELPPCVAVVATGEALNYATDPRAGAGALEAMARRARAALAAGGVFAGDVSLHGRSGPNGRRVQFHDRDAWSVGVIEVEDDRVVTRAITTFMRAVDGRYDRTDETHVLALYSPDTLLETLAAAGFEARLFPEYDESEGMAGWAVFVGRAH